MVFRLLTHTSAHSPLKYQCLKICVQIIVECQNQEMSEGRIRGQKSPCRELEGKGLCAKLSLNPHIAHTAIEFVFTDNLWVVCVKM